MRCLIGAGVMLVALVLLNMQRFRAPLYEWPGEYASTWIEWALASIVLVWFARPLYLGHGKTLDPYSHKWGWLPLVVAVVIAYLFSLAPTIVPDLVPDYLRGPKGGIVVLYKTLAMIVVSALGIRCIELWFTRSTQWQRDRHHRLVAWWAPQKAIVIVVVLGILTALFAFFTMSQTRGVLFGVSAAISALVVSGTYAFTLAVRLPAKLATSRALELGAAIISSDSLFDRAQIAQSVRNNDPREVMIVSNSDTLPINLDRLARATVSIAKQNWWLAAVSIVALLTLASGLLLPWLGVLFTPLKAVALSVVATLGICLNSYRLRLFR